MIIVFGLKRIDVKTVSDRSDFDKISFVYLYKTYYVKPLLRKYYKEGASVVSYLWVPIQKNNNIYIYKDIITILINKYIARRN